MYNMYIHYESSFCAILTLPMCIMIFIKYSRSLLLCSGVLIDLWYYHIAENFKGENFRVFFLRFQNHSQNFVRSTMRTLHEAIYSGSIMTSLSGEEPYRVDNYSASSLCMIECYKCVI